MGSLLCPHYDLVVFLVVGFFCAFTYYFSSVRSATILIDVQGIRLPTPSDVSSLIHSRRTSASSAKYTSSDTLNTESFDGYYYYINTAGTGTAELLI
jgi:hypothetical protein